MTNDLDLQLKRAFDDGLNRFPVPPRLRRSHGWRRLVVGVATASLIFACAGFASDVSATAAANGAACANVIAKLQLWAHERNFKVPLDTTRLVENMVADGGCQGTKRIGVPEKP